MCQKSNSNSETPSSASMIPLVCICTEPSTKHLHEICSSVWTGCFVNIRWLEGPGLGIIAGITAICGTVLLNCLPWARERGGGGSSDCVGVWCPPSFSVSVASPLYLILPGHQLLPEWHLLRHKTVPFRTTPSHPPQTALYRVPLWPGCGCEAKLTLLEWLQWQRCFSACSPGLALIWSASLYHPRLEPRRLTVKQADRLIDWLAKSQEAHNTACSIQTVLFRAMSEAEGQSLFIFSKHIQIFPGH